MNDVLKTEFICLLADNSKEVTNEEMYSAYAQFTVHMDTVSKSDDKQIIFRKLNLTRIEIAHLQTVFRYEQGEKCPEKCVLQKSDSIP